MTTDAPPPRRPASSVRSVGSPAAPTRNARPLLIGAGVFALVVVAIIILAVTRSSGGAVATPTPARPSPTATTRTGTSGPVAQTTWAEQNGLISLNYPSMWTRTRDASDNTNLVVLTAPGNETRLTINLFDPQQGTLQDEVQIVLSNQANSPTYLYTDQKTVDAQIGGRPAKLLTYTFTDKANPVRTASAALWLVNNSGKQLAILASPLGTGRVDADAIVGTIAFGTPKSGVFTDPDGVVRMQYPIEWALSKGSGDPTNLLALSGANDDIHVFVYAYPTSGETYEQALARIRDRESDDGTMVRTYDPPVDTNVGGAPAKSVAYTYRPKGAPDAQPGVATIWVVDHNGKRYEFRCSNIAAHRAEIEAVMRSVTFLK